MNHYNLLQREFDLKNDLFVLSSANHPYFSPKNILEIKKHYSNGLSKYTEKIKVEIVTDIQKCKMLWNKFSPKKSLFDNWEFRYAFNKACFFNTHFIVIKRDGIPLALLPLSIDGSDGFSVWFGTNWSEDNTFFTEDINFIPLLLFLAPRPLSIGGIKPSPIIKNNFLNFTADDSKFVLDLNKFTCLDEYLSTLKKKKRYNLRRDKRKIAAFNPKIVINNFSHYSAMVKLGQKRFREKGEETDWNDIKTTQTFKLVMNFSGKNYQTRMLSVLIGNRVAAVDLIAIFNGIYYVLRGSSDIKSFNGLGNYLTLYEIEESIKMGLKQIDFLQEDCGWKKSLFTDVPLYKYLVY